GVVITLPNKDQKEHAQLMIVLFLIVDDVRYSLPLNVSKLMVSLQIFTLLMLGYYFWREKKLLGFLLH
ncbi:hypothetical protein ACJX0J_030198, partial [Zea mays]